jgi:hypothetical protein
MDQMALAPCRECGDMVSSEAAYCPQCGIAAPAKRKARSKVFGLFGLAFIAFIIWVASRSDGSVIASPDHLDFGKPLFAREGAPFCRSDADLEEVIEHVGAKAPIPSSVDCFAAREGTPVRMLTTQGVLTMRAKVNWQKESGANADYWTVVNMLRN